MNRLSIPDDVKEKIIWVVYPASHNLAGEIEVIIELQIQQGNN